MATLVETLIADLHAFAPELLAPGLKSAALHPGLSMHRGTLAHLGEAEVILQLVPGLLAELQAQERLDRVVEAASTTPIRAQLSRRPADYMRDGDRLVPARWSVLEPLRELPTNELRWLLHIIAGLDERAARTAERFRKQVAEARESRAGESPYAREEQAALTALEDRAHLCVTALRNARARVLKSAGRSLAPSATVPNPYPRTPSWRRLRIAVGAFLAPGAPSAAYLSSLLPETASIADVAFLYERWCGMRVVQELETLGWARSSDAVWPLFLGGSVVFRRDEAVARLWIEPRFSDRAVHQSGFKCEGAYEKTPDLLLVTQGPLGLDGWVLDATMSTDPIVLASKGDYRTWIVGTKTQYIAGVCIARRPERSWAAAPLGGSQCKLLAPFDGSIGVVPMNVIHWNPEPLRAWLRDIVVPAERWSHASRAVQGAN